MKHLFSSLLVMMVGVAATHLALAGAGDSDGDGIVDALDNCITAPNADRRDTDGDGYGNICDADLNNDGTVNFTDWAIFRERFGAVDADADFDGSGGTVDFVDLAIFRSLFGRTPGPSGLAQTPPFLTSVTVSPSAPSIAVRTTRQFTAAGHYRGGSTLDISGSVSWRVMSSVPGVLPVTPTHTTAASISSTGLATGIAAGPITVTATLNGMAGTVEGSVDATPLIAMGASQNYLGFEGGLYPGSSASVTDPTHDAAGRAIAAAIRPLNVNGAPDSVNGKVVIIGMGMSSWTDELCREINSPPGPTNHCDSFTFMGRAALLNPPIRASTVLIDCAISSQVAEDWISNSNGNYTACLQLLASFGLSRAQVQVILWKDVEAHPGDSFSPLTPANGLSPSAYCQAHVHRPPINGDVDACVYMLWAARVARFAKANYFPNVLQMYLHSRIYGGYATAGLNPEPFAYEYGLATKWLIQAQIRQRNTGTQDPTAGPLDYSTSLGTSASVPWMIWGPYFWASGMTPRTDSQVTNLTWVPDDFDTADYTHPSVGTGGGRDKVAGMMVNYYLTSPYSTWFRP